jgi:L-ribulose-5-phosphate 3-epimerase
MNNNTNPAVDRRTLLKAGVAAGAGLALAGTAAARTPVRKAEPLFKISLAEWSLHHALFDKKIEHLDFPRLAKQEYGIEAVEYVNQFFMDKAKDTRYIAELKKRCDDLGVRSVLIMCDNEGAIGDPDDKKRTTAVENHYKWVEAAKTLGCHAIRVNAQSDGTYDEQMARAADGLGRLVEFGARHELNVIVENHGGLSSNGVWLAGVMKKVNNPRCGTLPDFGNFGEYDRYKGVKELMPYAKGVSAKTHEFDSEGNETQTDYRKMLKIVVDAGYHGHLGIEYEGDKLSEPEGIRATKKLVEKVREELQKGG